MSKPVTLVTLASHSPTTFKGRSPSVHIWATGVLRTERRGGVGLCSWPREGAVGQKPGEKWGVDVAMPWALGHQPALPLHDINPHSHKSLVPTKPREKVPTKPREKAPTFTWSMWSFYSAFFSPIRKSCLNLEYAVWMSCSDKKLLDRSSVLTIS